MEEAAEASLPSETEVAGQNETVSRDESESSIETVITPGASEAEPAPVVIVETTASNINRFSPLMNMIGIQLTSCNGAYEQLVRNHKFDENICEFHNIYYRFRESIPEQENAAYVQTLGFLLAASPTFGQMWQMIHYFMDQEKESQFKPKPPYSKLNYFYHPTHHFVHVISGAMHNYTDLSTDVCLALSTNEDFIQIYCEFLPLWLEDHMSGNLHKEVSDLCRRWVECAYNCYIKNDSLVVSNLNLHDFVTPAKPYLSSPDAHFQFVALLVVIFAVDEKRADLYLAEKDKIKHLLRLFKEAHLSLPLRRSEGFHVIELCKCVDRLAKNDINKELLVELEVLNIIKMIFDKGLEDEVLVALDLLFTLSFNEKNQDRIEKEFSESLKKLQKDERYKRNKALNGLNFIIMRDDAVDHSPITDRLGSAGRLSRRNTTGLSQEAAKEAFGEKEGHIMISYQHDNKEVVKRIKEELDKHNLKVWIDYEQMVSGSTIEAMAKAVENAKIVLLCMSRKYKESNNCRLEGEYAWKKEKQIIPLLMEFKYKPDGWLGLIIGAQLYHDFSRKYPFETKMEELVKVIKQSYEPTTPLVDAFKAMQPFTSVIKSSYRPTTPDEHSFPSPFPTLPPIGTSAQSVRGWSEEEVKSWCVEKKLSQSVQNLRLTGEEIFCLLTAKSRAPESFYRLVEKQCPLPDFRSLAGFLNALNDL